MWVFFVLQCHTGVLGCGHYVAYGKMANDKWWCLNDSSCKETSEAQLDKSSAYLLFFEREGLDPDQYLPKFDPSHQLLRPDNEADLEFDSDFKKQCSLM